MQNTENKNVKVKMTVKVTAKNNNKNVNNNKAEKYIFYVTWNTHRSSRPRAFYKQAVLKKFIGKHLL